MKTILILADESDESVKMVTKHLQNKRMDFVVLDTKKIPSEVELSIILDEDQMIGKIFLPNRVISISDIGVIWNRRIHKPIISSNITNQLLYEWTEEECYFVLESFLSMINCAWMNPVFPEEKIRSNKLIQMSVAKEIGLKIPVSIVSNKPDLVKDFHDGNVATILKPLKTGFMHNDNGEQFVLYTTEVPRNLLYDNLSKINICPVFLQEKIEKKMELRIVVIGESVFACAIDSQSNKATKIDWRKQVYLDNYLPHIKYDLPEEIRTKCIKLVKRLGLVSGSIDMILTPNNEYVFLEINQNGQWGWLEILTGLPISEAIANLLIEKNSIEKTPI